jgi:hypothetical protein
VKFGLPPSSKNTIRIRMKEAKLRNKDVRNLCPSLVVTEQVQNFLASSNA